MHEAKSPVKTSNIRTSKRGIEENFVIDPDTTIVKDQQNLPFEYMGTLDSTGIVPLHSVPKVVPEQLIKIKGCVKHESGVKYIPTKMENEPGQKEASHNNPAHHRNTSMTTSQTTTVGITKTQSQRVYLQIVKLKVESSDGQRLQTHALLDIGSQATLITKEFAEKLKLTGPSRQYTLGALKMKEKVSRWKKLHSNCLVLETESKVYPYNVPILFQVQEAFLASEVCEGPAGQPYAVCTIFGWSLLGAADSGVKNGRIQLSINHAGTQVDKELKNQVKAFWTTESFGTRKETRLTTVQEDYTCQRSQLVAWLASPEFLHKRDKQVSFQHSQVTDDLADDDAEIQKENMPIGSSHPSSRKISKVAEDIKGMQKERRSLRGTLLRLNPFIYTDGILRISTCLQHLKGHFCQFDLSRMPIASTDLASAAKGDFSNSFKELKTPEGSLAFAH
eukprot:gene2402-2766_t